MNAAAATHPDDVTAFARAAEAMRAAQAEAIAGRSAGVGDALREVRRATTELARLADRDLTGRGRASALPEFVERLTTVAASESATSNLRRSVLRDAPDERREPEASDEVRSAPPRSARAARVTQQAAAARARRSERDASAEAADRAADRRGLMRAVAEHERAHRTADHHIARAEHALAEAATRRDLAAAAVARAQAELERATGRVESATATVATLRAAADDEAAVLATLRARLDALRE